MANTIPQHGTSQSSQSQQQAGVAQPQGQMGGLGYQATQGAQQSGLVDKLAQSADQTAQKAIERVQETRQRAMSGVQKQQAQLGERIRDVSEALRSSGHKLDDNQTVASLLNVASEQVEKLASYVDNASPRSVASDLHNFARDRPAWFFGGAFLAGLALGRFAKSSARAVAGESGSDYERAFAAQPEQYRARATTEPTTQGSAARSTGMGASGSSGSSTSGYGTSGYNASGSGTTPGATSGSQTSGSQTSGSQTSGSQTSGTHSGQQKNSPSAGPSGYSTAGNNTLTGYGSPGSASPSSAPGRAPSTNGGTASNSGGSTPGGGKS